MANLEAVLARADEAIDDSVQRLGELVRIDSISTDPAHAPQCRKAAEWLVATLGEIGFSARVNDTEAHPVVVGHQDGGPEGAPHVLFYGHYDVQPVDPVELWTNDPFDMRIEERAGGQKVLTGRGTSDDKGQLMTFVEACRAYRDAHGALPCRITIVLEGDEESGAESLLSFLKNNKEELTADLVLVCDTGMLDPETPAIPTSLRGLVSEEITVHAGDRDLHSGEYGGAAANPIHILAKILADLHDANGRVTIPHFYDGVHETPDEIKAEWQKLDERGMDLLRGVGLSEPSGEKGRSVFELTWARPTAEVNGVTGGYAGAGFKTVIPAQASAKISFRLVGEQDPNAIRSHFRDFVRARIPSDCSVAFKAHGTSRAVELPHDLPALDKARKALAEEWGNPAVVIGMGGSIPVIGDFQSELDMDALLVGFAHDDDRIHSPNEKYDLRSFHKGVRSWIRILDALAE